jgi:hypothetical protein
MPEKALVIRYPNGDFEYAFTGRRPPVIGDTLKRKGEQWRVTRLLVDGVLTAYVERVEHVGQGAQSAPM